MKLMSFNSVRHRGAGVTADSVPPRIVPPRGHYPLADSVPFIYFAADSVPHVKVKNKGSSLRENIFI
jgi:hypothetical protein